MSFRKRYRHELSHTFLAGDGLLGVEEEVRLLAGDAFGVVRVRVVGDALGVPV